MRYKNYYCTPKFSDGEKTYYGDVEGVPEIPMIEAATLDDFERLFHQAVDDYLDRRGRAKPKTNWGTIITLVAIVALIVAAIATCPKKNQHVAFLTDRFSAILSEELGEKDSGLEAIRALFGNAIIKQVLNNSLVVDDYYLFSVGRILIDGQQETVSVGAFGHIFTGSKEQMKQAVEDYTDSLK